MIAALLDLHVLEPDLRRTGRGLEPGVALRLAAGLGVGRLGSGPNRAPGGRRADLGLPRPGAADDQGSSRPATAPTGGAYQTSRRTAGRRGLGTVGDGRGGCRRCPEPDQAAFVRRHEQLLDRSTAAALRARSTTREPCRRPPPTTGRCPSADRPCRDRGAAGGRVWRRPAGSTPSPVADDPRPRRQRRPRRGSGP